MSTSFDLTAARAAQRESTDDKTPFVFSWDGVEYTVLPSRDWPVEAVSLLSVGAIDRGLRLILGDEVWAQLDGLTVGDVELLFNALSEHEGLAAGNSLPRASRATRPKSKR